MAAVLVKVCYWILANKRVPNVGETVYLLFSDKETVTTTKQLYMFKSVICRKNEIKFLGMIIDDKIFWKSHTKHVHCKISKLNGLLCRVSDCFTLAALKTLYYSFKHPHFLYGIIFWVSVAKHDFKSKFRLQRKTVRILTRSPRYAYEDPIFVNNDNLKLNSILKLENCKFIHRNFYREQNF